MQIFLFLYLFKFILILLLIFLFKDPKFHLSVAWCLGDQSSQLKSRLNSLEFEIEVDTCRLLRVDKLMCKTGNKKYTFDLV